MCDVCRLGEPEVTKRMRTMNWWQSAAHGGGAGQHTGSHHAARARAAP